MIADLHTVMAWVVVFANGIAGVWALTAHWIESVATPWLWRFVIVAQSLLFVQVVLGVIRLNQLEGDPPQVRLETDDVTTVVHSLTSWAVQHGTRIDSLAVVRPNLEDTFLRLTDGPDA